MIKIGVIYNSKEGLPFKVVSISKAWCVIHCESKGLMNRVTKSAILNGEASMYLQHGGFIKCEELGVYQKLVSSHAYSCWKGVLARVGRGRYNNVTIHKNWLNFLEFYEFHERWYRAGYVLDKDLLSGENKIYSPRTCCFLPKYLNTAIKECSASSFRPRKGKHSYNFSFVLPFGSSVTVRCKTKEEYEQLFALYRTVRIRSLLSLCHKEIKPNAVERIIKLYNYTDYGKNTD